MALLARIHVWEICNQATDRRNFPNFRNVTEGFTQFTQRENGYILLFVADSIVGVAIALSSFVAISNRTNLLSLKLLQMVSMFLFYRILITITVDGKG